MFAIKYRGGFAIINVSVVSLRFALLSRDTTHSQFSPQSPHTAARLVLFSSADFLIYIDHHACTARTIALFSFLLQINYL